MDCDLQNLSATKPNGTLRESSQEANVVPFDMDGKLQQRRGAQKNEHLQHLSLSGHWARRSETMLVTGVRETTDK
jgi:hypothetical protein